MSEVQEKKSLSAFRLLLYIIIGGILLTIFLEATDLADVAGKREHEQIIDRPHD